MPSLDGATAWLNSPPVPPAGRRNKVVLVAFWTFTCIDWLRTLPYVRAWAERYKDRALVVIGVHTPEFAFRVINGGVGHNLPQEAPRAFAEAVVDVDGY